MNQYIKGGRDAAGRDIKNTRSPSATFVGVFTNVVSVVVVAAVIVGLVVMVLFQIGLIQPGDVWELLNGA